MNEKRTTRLTRKSDVPWKRATAHRGVAELRAKRGRPAKPPEERKEQIALRVDKDVLEWYRSQGAG